VESPKLINSSKSEIRGFVIASEAKQSHNQSDSKGIASSLHSSQWPPATSNEVPGSSLVNSAGYSQNKGL